MLLSIRNTFRRKGRLLLTLFTLTMAGAIFIAVFNVRVSMEAYMDRLMQHFMADVTLNFDRPYRAGAHHPGCHAGARRGDGRSLVGGGGGNPRSTG